MASVESTETAGPSAGTVAARGAARPSAALGVAIALGIELILGSLFVLGPLLRGLLPVTNLPEPLPDHHQDAETLIFVLAFALLLPLGTVAAARIADRIEAGPNGAGLPALVAALGAGLGLVPFLTRVSADLPWGSGPGVLAAAAGIWCGLAAAALLRAAAPRPWQRLRAQAGRASGIWLLAGLLLAAGALSLTHLGSISLPVLLVGLIVAAAVLVGGGRVRLPRLSARIGLSVDAALALLLLFSVPNLVVFATGDPTAAVQTVIIQFHQNFFLGPANQVLAGDAMLVGVLSQYGVGSIYFLAGAFELIPIGNGTLGLIEGVLSALMFIGTFAALRIAGVPRLVAGAAMALAVVVLVYGLQYPLGGLLQHGAFRFGLPVGVVVGAVAESRWPGAETPARGLQLLTLAVASIWALEAFAYTLLTLLAVVALRVAILPAGERRAELRRWAAQVVGVCVSAHLLLAAGTLAATGELPEWGRYLNTLREFLFGQLGDLTYDFSSFSPGLAIGALYLASASALALIVWRRIELARRERTMLVAIAAMTAFGVALFSYIVNRSADHIIPYVCLPAIALGALWLTLLGRPALGASATGRRAGLGIALALSALLVAVAWSSVQVRFPQSALAYARPGGATLGAAFDRLWNPPALRPAAPEGERLLDRYMPGESRSIVLTSADLAVETLIRSERGSAVPLGDPWEDSFVPDQHLAPLRAYVADLAAKERMLLDGPALEAFGRYRLRPGLDPLATGGGGGIVPSGLASLQEWVLREIGRRFDLRTIARGEGGLEVVELLPRAGRAASG